MTEKNTNTDEFTKIETKPKIDYTARVVSHVPYPVWDYLSEDLLFDEKRMPKLDNLKDHLFKEGRIAPEHIIELLDRAKKILRDEPNVLKLQDPITVCGDIHGQYYDLMKLFEIGGSPQNTQYLFLGDYVDRGCFGCEVVILMMAYKITYPKTFYMLRGNHECRHLTAYFNFKQECLYKYNEKVYDAIMDCFDCLPLAAILNNKFLCVHGGLSPDVRTVDDIQTINRFREPPSTGPMCDLLWSDPMDEEEEENNPDSMFISNELRGCSFVFSYNAVNTFLRNNNLLSVIRAHEAQDEGYRLYKKSTTTGFPTVICIFSAPNYCDVYKNKAAIIRFQDNLMNIRQFNCMPHPYYLPNFMNAFTWSLPFVAEKVTDILQVILGMCEQGSQLKPLIDKERGDVIRAKIRSVGRVCRMYSTLRQEQETILQLKGLAGGYIPQGLLSRGPQAIREALGTFELALKIDSKSEKRPKMNEEEEEKQEAPVKKKQIPMIKKLTIDTTKTRKPLTSLDSPKISINDQVFDIEETKE